MKKILSLQGGGCLGMGQAVVLNEIEKQLSTGQTLASLFERVVGTRVVSIVGACVAIGLPAREVLAFFMQDAPRIFGDARFWFQRLNGCYKYDSGQLEAALQRRLGLFTLADCKTKFIATAIEMTTGRNVYFQSYGESYADEDEIVIGPDFGWKLWEVARASSAAQSYFPAFVKGGMVFWDGGFSGQNAPDVLLLDESDDDNGSCMLSIGHGRLPWTVNGGVMVRPSFKNVIEGSFALATGAPASAAVWSAKKRLDMRFVRLNPKLARDFDIDDATPQTQTSIMATWLKCFDEFEPEIDRILSL
jgi:predicted acylesterase/phospholipase RssA